MIVSKIAILPELKKRGFSQLELLSSGIFGGSTLNRLRVKKGEKIEVNLKTVNTLCEMLDCEVADLIEYRKEG